MSYRLTGWRKIAAALWDAPSDPQIYGAIEIDATAVQRVIARARALGEHVTVTHLVGRALAHTLGAVPELNVRLVGDRAYPRETIDVFFITSVAQGHDLTGVKIESVDHKPVIEVARELDRRSRAMKAGRDPDLARSKRTMEALPRRALRVALRATAWAVGTRDLAIPPLGLAASTFGGAMVSSVGMLGIPMGFAPLAWLYAVPILILVGEIADKPVAIDGRVEVRPMLPLTATIDHRYVDGAQIGAALAAFRGYLEAPEKHEPALA